jgi:phage I-like protein
MLHEIQLIPFGYHVTSKGDFLLDEEALKLVVNTFDSQVNDLVVDYEHQTLSGKEAPAAGWIKKLMNRGRQGLWGLVDWTDRASPSLPSFMGRR